MRRWYWSKEFWCAIEGIERRGRCGNDQTRIRTIHSAEMTVNVQSTQPTAGPAQPGERNSPQRARGKLQPKLSQQRERSVLFPGVHCLERVDGRDWCRFGRRCTFTRPASFEQVFGGSDAVWWVGLESDRHDGNAGECLNGEPKTQEKREKR